jgi:chemotaxis protein CheZ
MTLMVEEEDWAELIQMLGKLEKDVCDIDAGSECSEMVETCRQTMRSFHTTAAMLGLARIEQVGIDLEGYLSQAVSANTVPQSLYPFGLALSALIKEMKQVANGKADVSEISLDEVSTILEMDIQQSAGIGTAAGDESVSPRTACTNEQGMVAILKAPASAALPDFSRLERIVSNLGGRLSVDPGENGTPVFQIRFNAEPILVEQIETLLSPCDPNEKLAPELSNSDARFEKLLGIVKELMMAMSSADVRRSQEILLQLAEQQHQAGLYNEIGMLARDLHNSLRGFADTLDPVLKEMVEEKLPDSGNRLEHILQLTEKAANTTLDNVEVIQKRNQGDQERLTHLREVLGGLRAVGEQAQNRLDQTQKDIEDLYVSATKTHEDLITVLTAQDYQDLTGQVIQKIINLLRDLELKLVNVIRIFGVKMESGKKVSSDELYGPAHQGVAEALHSQDDVDALLAEFGF